MYQPYPGGAPLPEQSGSGFPAPRSIARAVRVMYVGAVASLIGIAVDLSTAGSLRSQIASNTTRNGKKLTPEQVTNLVHVEIALFIVVGLIGAGLWIWLARGAERGKVWARIVSTVLFAIDTIGVLVGVGGAVPGGHATRYYGLVVWLVGLVAIILLWQRPSSDYFRGTPAR